MARLDDFGRDADSALALARSVFGDAETEAQTVRHMIRDHVTLATDPVDDACSLLFGLRYRQDA